MELGRAVLWGFLAPGCQGLLEQAAYPLAVPLPPWVAWQSQGICTVGKALWLVQVEILAEVGQTFTQVEFSSIWFRGCA